MKANDHSKSLSYLMVSLQCLMVVNLRGALHERAAPCCRVINKKVYTVVEWPMLVVFFTFRCVTCFSCFPPTPRAPETEHITDWNGPAESPSNSSRSLISTLRVPGYILSVCIRKGYFGWGCDHWGYRPMSFRGGTTGVQNLLTSFSY